MSVPVTDSMQRSRRPTWPVLLVMLAFLGGAGFLVYRGYDDGVSGNSTETARPHARRFGRRGMYGQSWQHHDWGSGGPSERGSEPYERGEHRSFEPESSHERSTDPQMWAMHRSFQSDGDAGMALPFSPIQHEAQIVSHEGSLASSPNASCEVRVLPVSAGRFNCLVRVVCGGHVLYPDGDERAGYAPCDVEGGQAVRAFDDGQTSADGDPLVDLDLRAGTVTIEDHGDGVTPFRATLRIGRQI